MKNDEALKILNKIKYKKDWNITYKTAPERTFGIVMHVVMLSYDPVKEHHQVTIEINYILRAAHWEDKYDLFNEVFNKIMLLEKHEAQEWFRYEDEAVYDPHCLTMQRYKK